MANGPRQPALVGGQEALGVVLDHREPVPFGQLQDRVVVGGKTVEADGDDGPGEFGDLARDVRGVKGVGPGIDIGKHGHGAALDRHVRGGDSREAGNDHFVPGADPRGKEAGLHGSRARVVEDPVG